MWRRALAAVDPLRLVPLEVSRRGQQLLVGGREAARLEKRRIHVLAIGKAAPFLFRGLERALRRPMDGGLVVSLDAHAFRHPRVSFLAGDHPLPGRRSLRAGRALLAYARRRVAPGDLVFVLVGGGASALAALPMPGVPLAAKRQLTRLLLAAGADVREINCLRKHLSAIKGGRLAEALYPTRHVTLVLSDIVGSPLEDVGSGPTVGDSSTFAQCWQILAKYDLLTRIRPTLRGFFAAGRRGRLPETPKPGDLLLTGGTCHRIGDNRRMLEAARQVAAGLGFQARLLSAEDRGDAAAAALVYADAVRRALARRKPGRPPLLLIAGGELTVTVRGRGRGGRNQEFMLHLLRQLGGETSRPFFALSMGSDGIDGPTPAAGAWIDQRTAARAARLGLDIDRHLQNNDSYGFFAALGQLVITGPTRTNVMDLRLFAIP